MDRRGFLRLAGAAVASAAVGGGCGSGSEKAGPAGTVTTATGGPGGGSRTLRIALLNHFVPAYDTWFDDEYTRRWGEEHDIDVIVDHIPYPQLTARADTEVASQRGHDIFGFFIPPAPFEDHVIDHREIVEEVEAKVGKLTPLVERSIVNPKTGKYFACSDYWSAKPVHYRADLWDAHGSRLKPDSWDDVLRAGPGLKAAGHPLGVGMSSDAANPEAAKQFLVDLALRSEESLLRSEFYNLPSFPGAVNDLGTLLANDSRATPPAKYAFLADAALWTRNLGHPGTANPAVADVAGEYLVSKMFASAARNELSPEEAVKRAHAQAKPIFAKWRERGKI